MAGYMGRLIMQEPRDLAIWDKFFADHPIKTFIELGTGHGGSTLFFGLKCHQYGIEFHTFDNVQSTDFKMPIELEINLAKSFHLLDIFSDEGKALIGGIIQNSPKPLAIFFDNGNKPREWSIFAPVTAVGDFYAVDTQVFFGVFPGGRDRGLCGKMKNGVRSTFAEITFEQFQVIDVADINISVKHGQILWLASREVIYNGNLVTEFDKQVGCMTAHEARTSGNQDSHFGSPCSS